MYKYKYVFCGKGRECFYSIIQPAVHLLNTDYVYVLNSSPQDRGLVVTTPGSQASVRRFESPLDPHKLVGMVAI